MTCLVCLKASSSCQLLTSCQPNLGVILTICGRNSLRSACRLSSPDKWRVIFCLASSPWKKLRITSVVKVSTVAHVGLSRHLVVSYSPVFCSLPPADLHDGYYI